MNNVCGECGEEIEQNEVEVIYDGEDCHLQCALDREDEIGFDDFFNE